MLIDAYSKYLLSAPNDKYEMYKFYNRKIFPTYQKIRRILSKKKRRKNEYLQGLEAISIHVDGRASLGVTGSLSLGLVFDLQGGVGAYTTVGVVKDLNTVSSVLGERKGQLNSQVKSLNKQLSKAKEMGNKKAVKSIQERISNTQNKINNLSNTIDNINSLVDEIK